VRTVADAAQMEALGAALAAGFGAALTVYLHGPLGAGKTTLVRGMLRGLGHPGAVKSPTFTLVEPYRLAGRGVYHFDLYRLQDPEELEFLGIRDYLAGPAVCLIEWAEKAENLLPNADLEANIQVIDSERRVELVARSDSGAAVLRCLA
jgi:tRNA threonylcarbamoyladenosine biosynthesis protein TsaE